jgi:hypothetical protein
MAAQKTGMVAKDDDDLSLQNLFLIKPNSIRFCVPALQVSNLAINAIKYRTCRTGLIGHARKRMAITPSSCRQRRMPQGASTGTSSGCSRRLAAHATDGMRVQNCPCNMRKE